MSKKIDDALSGYTNERSILEAQEQKTQILAEIAGKEYTPEPIPKSGYTVSKRMRESMQKENEFLEDIADGAGTISGANKLAIDYGTDVLSLKKGDEPIANSGVTLPAYGLSYDTATGGLTMTKNGTAIQGQTVSLPDYGSPLTASSTAGMTDTDKVYVNTTDGKWYYYDGDSWEIGGTYNSQGIDTDTTLLVSGAPADAKATGDAVADLKTQTNLMPISYYNIYAHYETVYKGKKWSSGTGLSMDDAANYDIYRVVIDSSKKYFLVKPTGTAYSNFVRFADAANTYLGTASAGFATLNTPPATSYYMYFRVPANELPVAIPEYYLSKYNAGFNSDLHEDVYIDKIADVEQLHAILTESVNLADPSKFTKNKYMTDDGTIGNNSSYFYTDKIAVAEGDVIYVSPVPRYKTAFNDDNVVSASISFPWTVPSGINGLIITGYTAEIDILMVSKDKELPFIPYGDYVNNEYLRIDNKNALNGNNGVTLTAETLNADTTLKISAYPKGLATRDRLTGYCEFSTFEEIAFGYGYSSNYFVSVDTTNIYKYYQGNVVGDPIPHGLTISDYLSFAIIMDNERNATITINTTSGSFSTTFIIGYSKNGLPFIRSSTALSNIKLSAISADIRKSIWWFGDSYSSNAAERVIGQLNNYGVIDNMLINAVPGMRTYYDQDTGAYNDLIKLLAITKPKYIIWTLGMNDTEESYKSYLFLIKNICDTFNITLYAAKIPSVPNIDNTGKSAYIDELGIKAIDWATAVHATSAGAWYPGFLSNDNVHPTVAGAQAMATRTLVDCPAIMQFD